MCWQSKLWMRSATSIPILLFSSAIYYASSIPAEELPDFNFAWSDKALHVMAFLAYGLAAQLAFIGWYPQWGVWRVRIAAFLVGATYGVLDEVHQLYVPGRNSNAGDWAADLLGLAIAFLFTRAIQLLCRSRQTV